jgi:hypothetical protein
MLAFHPLMMRPIKRTVRNGSQLTLHNFGFHTFIPGTANGLTLPKTAIAILLVALFVSLGKTENTALTRCTQLLQLQKFRNPAQTNLMQSSLKHRHWSAQLAMRITHAMMLNYA